MFLPQLLNQRIAARVIRTADITLSGLPISVVVTTKDAAGTINECLSAIFSNSPGEVIIVDGKSNDETIEIARKYPVVVLSDKGKGLSHARQLGAEAATQTFLSFVNPDVVLGSGSLSRMLVELERGNCTVIHARLNSFGKQTGYWELCQQRQHDMGEEKRKGDYLGILACLMRRETAINFGLDSPDRMHAQLDDISLEIKLKRAGLRLCTSNATAYHYWESTARAVSRHRMHDGKMAALILFRFGVFRVEAWPFIASFYWILHSLATRQARMIPYFVLCGLMQTVGFLRGLLTINNRDL